MPQRFPCFLHARFVREIRRAANAKRQIDFHFFLEQNLDAQKHPEQYRDLIVRVAGYSAFFVELCKDVQDEIISRTMLTQL